MTMAALFVERDGIYFGLPNIDPWSIERDARCYRGPHRVIAHPPCKRWGRYWGGAPNKPHQYNLGDDDGCFASALFAVRTFGGLLEHPADSRAWEWFGLIPPPSGGGWVEADGLGGWTCCVSQGHYGHMAGKRTWLYGKDINRAELHWGPCEQRIHPTALAKHGYAKARRIGMMAMVGGKHKERIRDATPIQFRDVLISIVSKGACR